MSNTDFDLRSGVELEISGKIGKAIPLKDLQKLAKSLEKLVEEIAKSVGASENELPAFGLELCGFREGSAVTQFRFITSSDSVNRAKLDSKVASTNEKLETLFTISSKIDRNLYVSTFGSPESADEVASAYFDFCNCMPKGNHLRFGPKSKNPIQVTRWANSDRDKIISKKVREKPLEQAILAKVIRKTRNGKASYSVQGELDSHLFKVAYLPNEIIANETHYSLNNPVTCLIAQEYDAWIIDCDDLDIHCAGSSYDEVIEEFHVEFDYLYKRLIDEPENKLGNSFKQVKKRLIELVKGVTNG